VTLQQQIRANRFRSTIVILGFVLLLVFLAGLIGLVLDVSLAIVALGVAAIYGVFGVVNSRRLVAGITQAQPVAPDELRALRRLVENVSIGAERLRSRPPAHIELRRRDDGSPAHDAETRAGSRARS
jgi:hypothetical protein